MHGLFGDPDRPRPLGDLAPTGTGARSRRAAAAHRDSDADLQRGFGAGVRWLARHPPVPGRHRPTRRLRLLRAQRHPRSGGLGRGGTALAGHGAGAGRQGAHFLSQPAGEHQPQERQPGGFLHPLGRPLPLHDRAGRRQHHEGRNPGRDGADHGAPAARGAVADPTDADQPRVAVRPHPAIRRQPVQPDVHRRAELLATGREQLLGPQRHHPHPAVPGSLRPAQAAGARAVRRRHPQSRFRRGGAIAAGRLGGLAGLRPGRQLRGNPADPDRLRQARPPLVPGQSPASAAGAVARLQLSEPAAFFDGSDVVPGLAAMAAVPDRHRGRRHISRPSTNRCISSARTGRRCGRCRSRWK